MKNYVDIRGLNSFEIALQMTRPANTTTYTAKDIINSGPVVNCAITDTSTTVTPSNMRGIFVGMTVTGTGIPANTTVATVGDTTITLNNAATATNATASLTFTSVTLQTLDFTTVGGVPNQYVQIAAAILKSSNGGASTLLTAQVLFYTLAAIVPDCSDHTAFAPSFANHDTYSAGRVDDISNAITVGSNAYDIMQTEIQRIVQLDSNGHIFPAILATNAYVPANGEQLTLVLKGYLL